MLKKIKNNPWPYAIIAYFVLFIGAMLVWIAFAARNNMELERADYYEHEIRFQAQIDRLARTATVRGNISVQYSPERRTITLALPKEHSNPGTKGEVHLYRPSDSRLDRRMPLIANAAGGQQVNVAGLPAGLWKLRVSWNANGQDFYLDQAVVLAN